MNEQEKALQAEGQVKFAQNPGKYDSISGRARALLPLTFCFCLLTANTLLDTGSGLGWACAIFAWYGLLAVSHGGKLWQTAESRFLLVTNLTLTLTSLVLGSSAYFQMWDTLGLLLVLLPLHAVGLSGSQRLPWWRPAMLRERLQLLVQGMFCHLGASVAVLPRKENGSARRVLPLAGGTIGALVLLAVLVPALSSADALFAAATQELRDSFTLRFTDAVWKTLAAAVMTPFFFGLLYFLRRPELLKQSAEKPPRTWDSLGWAIVLAAAAALYLLFLGIQTAGLLGGADYLASQGISYAEWARSGFFQIVRVTAVNLILLLSAVQWSRRDCAAWQAVRVLSALLTAESLALLVSAAVRMTLYVDVYGLTFKRFLTYWGMGMMVAFLLAAAWKVHRPDFRFCRVVFPLALAGWLVINCVPVDYLVAKDQVERYLSGESADLDTSYLLYELSYDAVAPLERLDGSLPAYGPDGYPSTLEAEIALRREAARRDCADWRTWSLSAYLAARGQ